MINKFIRSVAEGGSKKERRVNFLIAGTQKGGTTALHSYLEEHPETCMADQKEVHYFDTEDNFNQEIVSYSKYHESFKPKSNHKLLGEATPIYMYWKEAPKRIHEYNPEIKIILILRNPIDRAYSHWNMERMKNADSLSFSDAIRSETQRCEEALPLQHRVYSYIDRGHYLEQLERIWKYFPKNQVLIIKSEKLKENPNEVLREITDFLQISPFKTHDPPFTTSPEAKCV